MKEKNLGWVEQRETQQNQGFFVLGYSTRRLRLRPLIQPTPKFTKALKIKGSEFLFNESHRRVVVTQESILKLVKHFWCTSWWEL
ncbi:MAG TPA: hypothetical protein DEF48_12550 [Nostoc sp. UBA8866]|nr:hypothetical protein [Nostoc sp. UBA8866]